jgi:uncharacterized protein (TIGR02099 family)
MSLSSSPVTSPLQRGRWWRTPLRLVAWVMFAAWSLLLLAWGVLHWGILPHIDEWRPRVEALASRSVGAPVRIGRLQTVGGGLLPMLSLQDVALLDPQGREALKLPRIAAALSVSSLLALELRFEQLLIENAELDIRRDAAGRIRVAGLDMAQDRAGDSSAMADWFFEQHEFVIRGGTLRWTDELRRAPPLALTGLQLVVRNGLRRHDLRLDAQLPAGWGDALSLRARLRQPLLARAGDWRRWSGTLFAELPRAQVADLRQYLDLPFELSEGSGSLRAWLNLEAGQLGGGTADVALRDVTLRLAANVAPLQFAQLQGRLEGAQSATQWKVAASQFGFVTGDGQAWPAGKLALTLQRQAAPATAPASPASAPAHGLGLITGGEFTADRLDLAVLGNLGGRIPMADSARRLLAGMAPQGTVQDLSLRWDGPADAPRHYQARARLKGVSIAAAASPQAGTVGRPGVRQADIELQASETGGEARLAVANGAVEFPGVFEQPVVPITRLDTQLQWRLTPDGDNSPQVSLQLKDARFENEDVQGELNASWRTGSAGGFGKGARLPGVLDMSGKLLRGKGTSVVNYLPLGVAREARRYVQHAVQAGQVTSATFKVKGDLWDFPFYNAREGEFQIAAQVRDVVLAYVPSLPADPANREPAFSSTWPAFTQLQGELVFDRASMSIRNAQARLWGLELRGVNGGIADLARNSTLQIDGSARGPATDLLRYLNTSPVGEWTSGALAHASASGNAELKLALTIPLQHANNATVQGSVTLAGNDLRIQPGTPQLANVRARVDFSQKGFAIAGARAQVLGGEASIEGASQADGSLRFSAQGTATAEAMRRLSELPAVARAGLLLQGQAPYRVQLAYAKGVQDLLVTSPLTGLAIDLPAPLAKPAETSLALRVHAGPAADLPPGAPGARDELALELGPLFKARYLRDTSHEPAQVLRGAVAVNAPLPALVPGTHAVAELDGVNVDAWQAALNKLRGPGASGTGSAGAAAAAAAGNGLGLEGGYLPQSVALKARELVVSQRRISRLVLGLNHVRGADGDASWRANIDSDQTCGYVEYREPRASGGAGRVYARLARLSLPPSDVASVESLLEQAPATVPALDVVIDDFDLRGKKLGRVELEAVNRGVAGGDGPREWRLTKLKLGVPEAQLAGSGLWAAVPGSTRRRMVLDFRLDMADSGALLERLGFGRVVKGGKGRLAGQVQWAGSPLALDLPSLQGQVNLSLDAGQFLKADAGAGRLLGVMSLQSLPRRLALDFRDVFQEGFAFDNVSGDLAIERGVASTNNLRLRGVQAAVLMEGQADLLRETQDLRVLVVPEINAGTASLAYAAINPAVGLGTFVAQWLLRRPLQSANTREFHISGGWDDPKVDRVQRKPGEAAPDLDKLPAGAASPPVPATAAASTPGGNNP